jgi:hypothetical protein
MRRNREIFLSKHREWLSFRQPSHLPTAINGRTATRRPRVLLIEDQIPYRHLGSGFVRSADVVAAMVKLGCDVTVLPMNRIEPPADPRCGFDETVELLWNRDASDAATLLRERATYYDTVWVCRAHNMHRLFSVLEGGDWGALLHAHVVLDTEALACNREAAQARLEGRNFNLGRALARELRFVDRAHEVTSVNASEQAQLRAFGLPRVKVLGHSMAARATKKPHAARRDILALGTLYSTETPNFDGLRWFIADVWPLVRKTLGDVRLLVAGFTAPDLDVAKLLAGPSVEHLGFVEDPSELYGTARVFLAPTRFSAGIPFKVHEAASFGLPVMATSILVEQLGWTSGKDLASADAADPKAFAKALCGLYSDARKWKSVRDAALARVAQDCGGDEFVKAVHDVLGIAAQQRLGGSRQLRRAEVAG